MRLGDPERWPPRPEDELKQILANRGFAREVGNPATSV